MLTRKIITLGLVSSLMLGSLPALAEDTQQSSIDDQKAITTVQNVSQSAITAIQTAVENRDTAIMNAVDAYATAVKAALSARKDAIKASWGLSDKAAVKTALKKAWADYAKVLKEQRRLLKDAKKAAWKQYKTDRKTAKIMDEGVNEGVDAQL